MIALAGLIIFGVLAQVLAYRLKMPAILPLIIIGLVLGPISTLFTVDGTKIIEPMWDGSRGLFPGENLFYFVSLAVSIILYEGGMTLNRTEVLNISSVIINLITSAATLTFIGAGIAVHYLFDLTWGISFLIASLVIVTGPTVIRPILRYIPLNKNISAVLKWEGILIDPIGAVAAVLVFEFISSGKGGEYTFDALLGLGKIILLGFSLGFAFAHILAYVIRRNFIPKFLLNIFNLAMVLTVFVISNALAGESGLLAVVVMGMVVGNIDLPNFQEILNFKESLSVLLVSMLFILLAANINISDLELIYTWETVVLFVLLVFVLRPAGVFLSSINSPLRLNEKVFISWIGPRGIVAAGISSLFGLKLARQGVPGAEYVTPLVFMVVLGTVLLNAATSRWFAKFLGVFLERSEGILIVGASSVSRTIASYLQANNRHVVLLDTNSRNIRRARDAGLEAIEGSVYSDDLSNNIGVSDVGYVMALTGNAEINNTAIEKYKKHFGENGTFRLVSPEEIADPENNPKQGLFSPTDGYNSLVWVASKHPEIKEIEIKSQEHYAGMIEISKTDPQIIPLFIKDSKGDLSIITSNSLDVVIEGDGYKLAYLGKGSDFKKDKQVEEDIEEDLDN